MKKPSRYILIVMLSLFIGQTCFLNGMINFSKVGKAISIEDTSEEGDLFEKNFEEKYCAVSEASLFAPNITTLIYFFTSSLYSSPVMEVNSPPPNFYN